MLKWLKKNGRRWLPAALYAAFLLVWLCGGLVGLAANRAAAPAELDVATAAPEGLLAGSGSGFLSQDGDPKLVFSGIGRRVRHIRLAATFTADPKEMDLFYTTKPGQGFSVRHRVIGRPVQGGYLYTLPPFTNLQDLRLDLGTAADNGITIHSLLLDPPLPAGFFLFPTLRTVAAFALVPALALCAITIIMEWYTSAKKWLARRGQTGGKRVC